MPARFVTIWFRHLRTDWHTLRQPALRLVPFVLSMPDHGRMRITALNAAAEREGIRPGMVLADARALNPGLRYADDDPALGLRLLRKFAEWLIRFSPVVAVDAPDGITLDASGCAHLWNGEEAYLTEICKRISGFGYEATAALADTAGAAWGVARFGDGNPIVAPGDHIRALLALPPDALRLAPATVDRLNKLGLRRIRQFARMPRPSLRRRFGPELLERLDRATGTAVEFLEPVSPPVLWSERLPCLEPIVTATGIAIALRRSLDALCARLQSAGQGLRTARFHYYRVDGKTAAIAIGTHRPSHRADHLYRLFEENIAQIEPGLGIELFVLEAPVVELLVPAQERLWEGASDRQARKLAELIDRIAGKLPEASLCRYLPVAQYWPELSIRPAASFDGQPDIPWRDDKARPVTLLSRPEPVQVMVMLPDYPPSFFTWRGKQHKIARADGPERIERAWWTDPGPHRDYYAVEDAEGRRFWLFRSGHYYSGEPAPWFLHGFFA